MCLLIVPIGRLGCHGAGLAGVPNKVPAAAEHEFGRTAVQCESQALPGMLEEDGLAHPVVDVVTGARAFMSERVRSPSILAILVAPSCPPGHVGPRL